MTILKILEHCFRSTINLCGNAALYIALENTMLTEKQLRGFDHDMMVNFAAETIQETFTEDISDLEVLKRLYSWTCHNQSSPYYLGLLEDGSELQQEEQALENTFMTRQM